MQAHTHTRTHMSVFLHGCPGTKYVDQADLELKATCLPLLPVLGLKACVTPGFLSVFETVSFTILELSRYLRVDWLAT